MGTIEADSGALALVGHDREVSGDAHSPPAPGTPGTARTLAFPGGTNITANQANVTLGGQAQHPGIQGLATNSGTLTLTGGATFTTVGDLGNTGIISVGPAAAPRRRGQVHARRRRARSNVQLGRAPSGGQFGKVAVTGSSTLAGSLQSELVNGYADASDGFSVMSFASATGRFASINTPLFHGGSLFDAQTNPTNMTIAAATSVADLRSRASPPARLGADRPEPDGELFGEELGERDPGDFVGGLGLPLQRAASSIPGHACWGG